ncbi:MAG: ABC transporter ATP-binding protein [Bdellovibrio sp.]|nr:ABC transporter ATP-binding protein [Bdellovibrio sp.]
MDKRFFQRLYPYLAHHKGKVIGALIFSFLLALLKAWQAYLVKPIFDQGLSANASLSDAVGLAGLLLLIMILNFPCRFYHFYWLRYVVDQTTCRVREQFYRKIQNLPLSFFNDQKQGALVSGLVNDTHIFSQGLKGAIDIVREPLTAVFMFGLALYRDWQLTLVIVLVAPLFVYIFSKSGRLVRKNQHHVQEELGDLTHTLSEGIIGNKVIKAFSLQNLASMRFLRAQDQYFNHLMKTTIVEEIAHPMVELVGALAFSGIIVFAHYRIQSRAITTGDFISFITAMALLMDPIRKYAQANIKLNQAQAAGERIFHFFDLPEEVDQGRYAPTYFSQEIVARNLSFSYGEKQVLKNVNFTIKKGERVAFVGPSGAGKTSLINLFLGLYSLPPGMLFIDGKDVCDTKNSARRSFFGLVGQDVFLFNDTIAFNLCLTLDRKDEQSDRLQEALNTAYATSFVKAMPEQEQTIIGDRGVKLSGGQQQRITLARALMRNPPIYLFDEATSALDNESERFVQKAMGELGADKTIIAVAHRLSTIADFDRIYVMRHGEIVEQGTHAELLSTQGEYFKLYQLGQSS